MTLLEFTIPVPPELEAQEFIEFVKALYQTNYTDPGVPITLESIEVLAITLNGKSQHCILRVIRFSFEMINLIFLLDAIYHKNVYDERYHSTEILTLNFQ